MKKETFILDINVNGRKGGVTYVDAGSHTEFFHIVEEGNNGLFY